MKKAAPPAESRLEEAFRLSVRLMGELVDFSEAELWEVSPRGRRPRLRARSGGGAKAEGLGKAGPETVRYLLGRVAARGVWYAPDLSEERELAGRDELLALGLRSLAALPVGAEGRPWGLLVLYADGPMGVDGRQGLLEAVAAETSLALDTSRRETRLRARLLDARARSRRLSLLARHLRRLRPGGDPEEVAGVVADAAYALWGAPLLILWIMEEGGEAPRLAGLFGSRRERASGLLRPEEPLVEKLIRGGRPRLVRDLATEPLWRSVGLTGEMGLGALMGAPLVLEGRPVGAVAVLAPSPERFLPGDGLLLEMLARPLVASWELGRILDGLEESRGRLERAEGYEALAKLAVGETHDFNNALGLILGNAHMLRSKLSSTEEALRSLDVIEQAVSEASERVRRLQGLRTTIAEGPRVAPVDLNNVAEEVLGLMRARFKEALAEGVTLELKRDLRSPLPVFAHPVLMREALLKVVMSSLRPAPRGGKVTVRTWEDLRSVHLSVTDAGPQAAPSASHPVSSPSERWTAGPTADPSVASAHRLIRAQRGEVVVRTLEGRGTSVTITFPKASPENRTALLSPLPAPVS